MTYDLKELKDKAGIIWLKLSSCLHKIRKRIPPWLWILLIFLFGILVRPYLAEFVSLFAQRHFSAQQLHYEVSSISSHKRYELFSLANAEGLSEFNLELDDPILTDYYLAKVKLRNDGIAIENSLKFNVTIMENCTKILDIKHRVLKPTNKSFRIIHSLPPLTWKIPEDFQHVTLTWSCDPHSTAGFHVYRSVLKNVGYGRVNEMMLTQPEFRIQLSNLSICYYRVTMINTWVRESKPCDPMRFPDGIAFLPLFEDVFYVNPNIVSENAVDGTRKSPFRSLAEGIEAKGKSATFIFEQSREEVMSYENLSKNTEVFYEEDLDFLKGRAKVSLLNGIDEDAEIELFFLFKTVPGERVDVNMKLEGAPQIKFKKRETRWWRDNQRKEEAGPPINQKVLLTPENVKTYLGEGVIYMVWKKPEGASYKGVRIFRSEKRSAYDLKNFGQEMYDGPGCTDRLERTFWSKSSIEEDRQKFFRESIPHSYVPPPQETSGVPPLAPTGIGIRGIQTITELDDDLLYFADNSVSSNKTYTYTLWAYDDEETYSYPIIINTCLSDWSPRDNCYPKPE